MGRVYTVDLTADVITSAGGDHDFFELRVALGKPIRIIGLFLGQETELGDAAEEFVRYAILEMTGGTFTSGTGGATPTPEPVLANDPAAGFAADAANPTVATSTGTTARKHSDTFNIRAGLQIWFPPNAQHTIPADDADNTLLVRLESSLADDATFSGTVYVEEMV